MVKKLSIREVLSKNPGSPKTVKIRERVILWLKTWKHDNCVVNITKMRDASKEYKKALKQNRRDYYKEMNCNIKKLHSTDPKAYWNMLKSKNSRNHEMPNLKDFENHFGSLNAAWVMKFLMMMKRNS